MASWGDIIALVLTTVFFLGTIGGVWFLSTRVNEGVKATKETLKQKGVNLSDKGVSIKTQSRFTREDYIDATQRAFMKLPASGAASFGHADDINKPSPPLKRTPTGTPVSGKLPAAPSRTNSTSGEYFPQPGHVTRSDSVSSVGSAEKKKKSGLFSMTRKNSGSKS
ncbi:hypothetical protein PUNSTDRAFT_55530 [Punctularia strigosozonata HHB-11173 SS5]|uniref:Uncharacterized protein n=1 Tax=Punctularia strigosozonata (strain HHB-11173) TaxID=741275 RepID=R7S3Z1_PUNST|nr:uncharacterized protein PUNSTDRAFT_55530 [Punctularia strigosozonata HHB-11173 SS5]EIN04517.1 hypothetical protein PUNSTDRAFT_55530 [Punctularia strigosozonata HHB-11173 SS5]